jgi:salicylate hydroxylase
MPRSITSAHSLHIAIAGAGIGGLSAALALTQHNPHLRISLWEQSSALSPVGAGLQLGPNAMRRLQKWGLSQALREHICQPDALRIHAANDGDTLATLRLGDQALHRYQAPYATILRADLQNSLLTAVQANDAIDLRLGQPLEHWRLEHDKVYLQSASGTKLAADALIAANGVHSPQRLALQSSQPIIHTGHQIYRALLEATHWPEQLQTNEVHVWLGNGVHVVAYAVCAGQKINIVVDLSAHHLNADISVPQLVRKACGNMIDQRLDALLSAGAEWLGWPSLNASPVSSATQLATGRLALLGDAAHPMMPHLAQGAAMAIEDADVLSQALKDARTSEDLPAALAAYAHTRHARVAQVQKRAARNVQIFHASGWLRWGRDLSLRLGGERLLDLPWLYSY